MARSGPPRRNGCNCNSTANAKVVTRSSGMGGVTTKMWSAADYASNVRFPGEDKTRGLPPPLLVYTAG